MTILQINSVYKKGSTGKIVYDVHRGLLANNMKSVVCYGRGDVCHDEGVYKICSETESNANHFLSYITGIMYGGCFFSTRKLISVIKKEKPDVVHLHCLNGYFVNIYTLLTWLKNNNIKTLLTLHAEFMYTGGCGHSIDCNQWSNRQGCGHPNCPRWRSETRSWFFDRTSVMWKRMKKAFNGFNNNLIVSSVSPWLMKRAKLSAMLSDKNHNIVLNGVDDSVFKLYDNYTATEIKKRYNINGNNVIFHATPEFNDNPNHIKGGYYLIELAKLMPLYQFVVAGSYQEKLNLPPNIILLGKVVDQIELAKLYSMADITLLTSKKETFSMVVAESLSCGTPVVGFKAGAPEEIACADYSSFCEHGDLYALQQNVAQMIAIKHDKVAVALTAKAKYAKAVMTANYIDIYKQLMSD